MWATRHSLKGVQNGTLGWAWSIAKLVSLYKILTMILFQKVKCFKIFITKLLTSKNLDWSLLFVGSGILILGVLLRADLWLFLLVWFWIFTDNRVLLAGCCHAQFICEVTGHWQPYGPRCQLGSSVYWRHTNRSWWLSSSFHIKTIDNVTALIL